MVRKAYIKAREYFGLGAADDDFVLHHVDPTLKTRDPKRYNEWRPEDLVVMTRAQHTRLHHIGNKHCKGKKLSEEHKKKLSEANKGKKFSEEHKKRIGEAHRGKKHSEESRKKISESLIGKKARPVEQYALNGELVRVWESAKAAEVEGFQQSNIIAVCKGKRPHHKKYIWKYSQRKK